MVQTAEFTPATYAFKKTVLYRPELWTLNRSAPSPTKQDCGRSRDLSHNTEQAIVIAPALGAMSDGLTLPRALAALHRQILLNDALIRL